MRFFQGPIFWLSFFVITSVCLYFIAGQYSEPREIVLSSQQAHEIGKKIWMNEGAGKTENLVVWNEGEDFPSLGIGHFIWYPQDVEPTFTESFPGLLEFVAKHQALPPWLAELAYPPWPSRESFLANPEDQFIPRLRAFLASTIDLQTLYIVDRMEDALPSILKEIKNPFAKKQVRENFYHVAMQTNGVYALVDYVNFKGEGISTKERYRNLGWGLSQVLQHMRNKPADPLKEFVRAADFVLTRRVENAPRDESRWLPGWRKRLRSYLE